MRAVNSRRDPEPARETIRDEIPVADWWNEGGQGSLASGATGLTYDDVAAAVADDPDPARSDSLDDPGARDRPPVRITAAVRRDIEGKLAFWGSVGVDMWALVDPYCADAAASCLAKSARTATPLICQSPQLVEFFTRASGFMLWTEFLLSLKPLLVAFAAHHVTKSVRHPDAGELAGDPADWSAYSAVA